MNTNQCLFVDECLIEQKISKYKPDWRDVLISSNKLLKSRLYNQNCKIDDKNLFNFPGSKHFFDYLRKEGAGSVDKFLKMSGKPSWNKTYTFVNIGNKKKQDLLNLEGENYMI